jgi:hypothetical protein
VQPVVRPVDVEKVPRAHVGEVDARKQAVAVAEKGIEEQVVAVVEPPPRKVDAAAKGAALVHDAQFFVVRPEKRARVVWVPEHVQVTRIPGGLPQLLFLVLAV